MIKSMLIIAILATVGFKTYAADVACKPNEVYAKCGICEATCDNQNPLCHKNCQPPGCYCSVGFVRNANNDCVPVSSCPIASSNNQSSGANNSICKENEMFLRCGGCELTCGNLNPLCQPKCWPAGCYCFSGYARNATGNCILISECLSQSSVQHNAVSIAVEESCKPNEVYKECGLCDKSCDNQNPACHRVCQPGCYCAVGFVRDENNDCVPVSFCPIASSSGHIFKTLRAARNGQKSTMTE